MPYEDSQERTSPPSLSRRTAHLSKMGVRPARAVHKTAKLPFGRIAEPCPKTAVSGQDRHIALKKARHLSLKSTAPGPPAETSPTKRLKF
jgi:hypothetical protein